MQFNNINICGLIIMAMTVGCARNESTVKLESSPKQTYAPPAQIQQKETSAPDAAAELPDAAVESRTVVEMYKGQAEQCARAAPHSMAWDMHSCDDLARVKRGQKPANDFDDWFKNQKVNDVDAWLGLQTRNKSFSPTLVPIGHKAVLAQLRSPSTARFVNESVVLSCPDMDTFVAAYNIDAQNGFGAVVRDMMCAAISSKNRSAVVIDCAPLANILGNLTTNRLDTLPTNVRLMCEGPARFLHL